MPILLQLDDDMSRRVEQMARELNVNPTDLIKMAIDDFLSKPLNEFEQAARYVLEKNRELYRRLS